MMVVIVTVIMTKTMSVRTIMIMIIMLNRKLTTPREGNFRDNETKTKLLNTDSIKKPQAALTSFRVARCVVENVCFLFEICEWGVLWCSG